MTLKIIETILVFGSLILGGYAAYKSDGGDIGSAILGVIAGGVFGALLALFTHIIWS